MRVLQILADIGGVAALVVLVLVIVGIVFWCAITANGQNPFQ